MWPLAPAIRKELDWQDLRAAIAALKAMADIDQGRGIDARIAEVERRLGIAAAQPNGNGRDLTEGTVW